ncbi:50S ribosomal protein L14e [Candidatus Woesearchaeota archaeon]|nr:50S ribosomal protein L14e [Candidatus Woesearchaeota archaeon]
MIGRLCVKIAGRDSGKRCVVVDVLDDNFVMIDGETRRRKCNIMHLEPLEQTVEIQKGASHDDVVKAFERLGLKARVTRPKEKKEKPKRVRSKRKLEVAKPAKEKKKEAKAKKKEEKVKAKEEKKKVKKEVKPKTVEEKTEETKPEPEKTQE